MQAYINQLLADIDYSTKNVTWPFATENLELHDWMPDTEEDETAPVIELEEWTGIYQEQLPPQERLADEQVEQLLKALNGMLNAYNWYFVLQIAVPERIQYETIRLNFSQPAKQKRWHMGFFEVCKPGTGHKQCTLGEYCQCAFFAELHSHFIHEDLTPEEERARDLEMEISHLKRKYDDDREKYYPYHLDPKYDDENGNPYDYGIGEGFDDEEEDDDWWKR